VLLDDLHWIVCVCRILLQGWLMHVGCLPQRVFLIETSKSWLTMVYMGCRCYKQKRSPSLFYPFLILQLSESFHFLGIMLDMGPDSAAVPRQPVSSADVDLCLSGSHCGRSGAESQHLQHQYSQLLHCVMALEGCQLSKIWNGREYRGYTQVILIYVSLY
jgi:hypothetical protein